MTENKVTSVNGKVGRILLTPIDYGLLQETWSFTELDSTVNNYKMVIAKSLIRFTLDGIMFYAESEMTWSEWCSSKYNTLGAYITDDYVEFICLTSGRFMRIYDIDSNNYALCTEYIVGKEYTSR